MTLNYNSTFYSVILANAYNKQRNNIICTAQFVSWSIFTPTDDEFLEECMSVFLKWTEVSPSLRHPYPFFPFPTPNTSMFDRILPSRPTRGTNELINGGIHSTVCVDEMDSSIDKESEGYGSDSSSDYDSDSEDSEGDDMSSSLEDEENTEEGYCSDDTCLDCDTYSIFGGGSRISSHQEEEIDCDSVPYRPTDASITLSSLFLRDRSIGHYSILSSSSSSSIDSHIYGSECLYCDRLTTEDEREPLLGESISSCVSLKESWKEDGVLDDLTTSSSSDSSMKEEMDNQLAIEMMKECDETIKRMEEMKKDLKKMIKFNRK